MVQPRTRGYVAAAGMAADRQFCFRSADDRSGSSSGRLPRATERKQPFDGTANSLTMIPDVGAVGKLILLCRWKSLVLWR